MTRNQDGAVSDSAVQDDNPPDLPPEIDITVPSVARGYDYALGGKNNFAVDRAAMDRLIPKYPGVFAIAKANREFLRRGIKYLVAEAGITQFIDVGSGLPSAGNVHEVAHRIDPTVRVVYVDIDPIVLAHGRALLANNNTTTVIKADAKDPASILGHPETHALIDFDRPFAVVLSAILHHVPDDEDPIGLAHAYTEPMPSGSYLMVGNFLDDDDPSAKELEAMIVNGFGSGWFRTWEQQRPYFDGLELVEPGLVYGNDWRPDEQTVSDDQWHTFMCGGIGRKP